MVPPTQRAGAAGMALPCATLVLLPLSLAPLTSAPCPSPWRREGCFCQFGQQWVSLRVLRGMSQARQVPWHSLLMSQPQGNGTVRVARLGMTGKLRGLNVFGVPMGRKQGSHIPVLRGTTRCCSPAHSLMPAWTELLPWPAASPKHLAQVPSCHLGGQQLCHLSSLPLCAFIFFLFNSSKTSGTKLFLV